MTNESVILPRGALRSRIDELGRIQIAHLPTPLEFCPRLTEAISDVARRMLKPTAVIAVASPHLFARLSSATSLRRLAAGRSAGI